MKHLSVSEVESQIHWIRGHQVILDSALARYYQVETGALKRAVRRNASRFPNDFMFELTETEAKILICQIGTSKPSNPAETRGGNRHAPFVFTEAGVAMLSSVLNSERAVEVNIAIIRAFIELRKRRGISRSEVSKIDLVDDRLHRLENQLSQVLDQMKALSTIGS